MCRIYIFVLSLIISVTANASNYGMWTKQSPDEQAVGIWGELYPGEASQIVRSLQQVFIKGKNTRVVLNMGGGYDKAFHALNRYLKEVCPSHSCRLTTEVRPGVECTSACIITYMIGQVRIAAPTSTFGFHAAESWPFGGKDSHAAMRMCARAGVNPSWLQRNSELFDSTNVTDLTPAEIRGSNIVTELNLVE